MNGATGSVTSHADDRQTATPTVEREDLFELLGNCRRRYVIEFFQEHQGQGVVTLDTLARHVAARENDTSVVEVTAAERKRVYTSLQQTHLPQMDDAGAVVFDKERGTIAPADHLAEFSLHLDVVPKRSIPLSVFYLSLSLFSLVLLVAVVAGLPLVRALSPFWWGCVVLLLFGGVAAVHHLLGAEHTSLE